MIALYIVKAEWWLIEQLSIHILRYILVVGIDTGTNKNTGILPNPIATYKYTEYWNKQGVVHGIKPQQNNKDSKIPTMQ